MVEFFGRFHPLLVHLPVGIVILALLFEWLAALKRYAALRPALPLIWKTGALLALLSCATGWLLARSGGYEALLLSRHQYFGLTTAAGTGVLCFLPKRRVFGSICGMLLLITVHLGASLTHGEGYLGAARPHATAISEESPDSSAVELPDIHVSAAAEADIAALRRAGLAVVPLAIGSPWLSVSFVNATQAPDSLFGLLEKIAPQLTQLNLHGVALPDSGWTTLARCRNLTRLNLSASNVEDRHLTLLAGLPYLCLLNLSQTRVQLQDPSVLTRMPALRRVFLYQTAVSPAQWPPIFAALPGARIDTGGYVVPTLKTDTVLLREKGKY